MARRLKNLALSVVVCLTLIAGLVPAAALAAYLTPGASTLTIDVGDDYAGGSVSLTFELAYSNTTLAGTPVYVYVPQGALGVSGAGDESVDGMNPAWDPNPGDGIDPCPSKFTAGDYLVTQAQVDTLGDELTDQIVKVDEDHYGPIGEAVPGEPDTKALVVLAYNVLDDFYYDCAATTYTAGYFAPGFIAEYGMNVIVTDTFDWDQRITADNPLYQGVIAHELEHLLMNYSDSGELSWVDEGLADMAIFLNGWGRTNRSHVYYHQVFHRETSLTRWGGGLENYGASFTYFLYLWEQAGGNGGGSLTPDLVYNSAGGDLLIKLIFQNAADGMAGVQAAINSFNTLGHPGRTTPMPSAQDMFKDWAVAIYLDSEIAGSKFGFNFIDFGTPTWSRWTIDVANDVYWGGRGIYTGNMPDGRWRNFPKVPPQRAVPFGVSYETFRNPGPTFGFKFTGDATTAIAPHSGPEHWYGGYQSMFESILDVTDDVSAGGTLDFWTWYFIEEGWDFGFVEYSLDGGATWLTMPLNLYGTTTEVTTNDDPHGNNTEGNGLTGTSGGAYFVDDPEYIHLEGAVPAGATDLRFRYSTDAAYLDTGWFVDDVNFEGNAAGLDTAPGNWISTTGTQNNNWVVQIVSPCDLTPGSTADEISDPAGTFYRYEGASINKSGFNTACMRSDKTRFAVVISNLPTGDLTFLDADYSFRLTNTGNTGGTARGN